MNDGISGEHTFRYVKIPNAPAQVATGTFTWPTSGNPAITINVGFKPTFIGIISATTSTSKRSIIIYDSRSGAYQITGYNTLYIRSVPYSTEENGRIKAVTDTGFTLYKRHSNSDIGTGDFRYVAAKFE